MVHHARIYAQLRPVLTSQPGAVSYTIDLPPKVIGRERGSLPVGDVNLCLYVTHKNTILLGLKKRPIVLQRTVMVLKVDDRVEHLSGFDRMFSHVCSM